MATQMPSVRWGCSPVPSLAAGLPPEHRCTAVLSNTGRLCLKLERLSQKGAGLEGPAEAAQPEQCHAHGEADPGCCRGGSAQQPALVMLSSTLCGATPQQCRLLHGSPHCQRARTVQGVWGLPASASTQFSAGVMHQVPACPTCEGQDVQLLFCSVCSREKHILASS